MKSGQSLIEVLVAIGIAMLLGVSLVSTSILTQKASRSTQNTAYGTKLAQELTEELRIFRDQSRDKLAAIPFTTNSDYRGCYTIPSSGTNSTKNGDGSLNVTPGANGNLQWTFTNIVIASTSATCPTPPGSYEQVISNNVAFYRYVLLKRDISPLTGITCTVYVSWQEQSGWRTIAQDVYLTNWVGP